MYRVSFRGFSILESLVVMAIIVLIASIAIPGLLGRKAEVVPLPEDLGSRRVAVEKEEQGESEGEEKDPSAGAESEIASPDNEPDATQPPGAAAEAPQPDR